MLILSTHHLDEAELLGDRVAVVLRGGGASSLGLWLLPDAGEGAPVPGCQQKGEDLTDL